MRIVWIIMALLFCIFFPTALANRWCYGPNWDEVHIKSKAQYWRVFIIFMLPFAFLCFVIGSDIGADDIIDNIKYYYRLRDGGEEYLSRSGWALEKARLKSDYRKKYEKSYYKTGLEPDDYVFHLYCTRKRVDENFIYKIAQNEYTEIFNNIELVKTDKNHWTVCSGEEVLGYAESQGGFFLKKVVFLMYYGKIHVTQKSAPPKEIWSSEEEEQKFYEYVESQWRQPTEEQIEHEKYLDRQIRIKLIFLALLACACFILFIKQNKNNNENNQPQHQPQGQHGEVCQSQQICTDTDHTPNPTYSKDAHKMSQQLDIYQTPEEFFGDKTHDLPDLPQEEKPESGQWKQTPVWGKKE